MPGLLGGTSDKDSKGAGRQPGYPTTPLHSGSRFVGHQQSKGNKYVVEVVFKVSENITSPPSGSLCTTNAKRSSKFVTSFTTPLGRRGSGVT